MFFNLSMPILYMNESVSRFNSDGKEGQYTGKKMVYVAWLQFSSFGLHFHIRLESRRVPLCNKTTLAAYIKSCLTTDLHTFKKSYFFSFIGCNR